MKQARVLSRVCCAVLLNLALAGCSSDNTPKGTAETLAKTASADSASVVTLAGDERRTGWYPNQARLAPSIVGSASFGQLFSTVVTGQIYAQPLVSNGVVFVATETNDIYGLDPETGLVRWTRNLGKWWNPQDVGCNDLVPNIGVTGTPVIDSATKTAYLLSKVYASGTTGPAMYQMHAINLDNGAEQPNFPVQIQGKASNDATRTFDATHASQRPGLLLMGGVIYAAFGAHCDRGPWAGWVAGVSTSGAQKALWTTMAGGSGDSGAGIWQSGGGLVSDRAGGILFTTGNGGAPKGPITGDHPPQKLGEAVVRLTVQSDGSLQATDFFAPYDAQALDGWDADLSSGGLTALPTQYFGTGLYPNLVVQSGKQGYVYLLDLDNLGGIGNGAAGADLVVNRVGPYGGVWSSPAVWPGDGGYVYIPTASGGNASAGSQGLMRAYHYGLDGNGKPTLSLAGSSKEALGFSSSHPIVTSDGTTSGSALLWLVWSPSGAGTGAQLRAYDALPNASGDFTLRFSAPVGVSAKFTPPGVGNGRVYVGTRDGHVLGFGATVPAPLSAPPLEFEPVIVGQTATGNVVFTASGDVVIDQIVPPSGDFSMGNPTPSLPATLHAGDTLSFSVTFKPTSSGLKASSAEAVADNGRATVTIAGRGRSADAQLITSPTSVSFGATTIGGHIVNNVTFSNTGAAPLTINSVTAPSAPFVLTGTPPVSTVLNSDESVTLGVEFAPTALGNFVGSFSVDTTAGKSTVQLSGRCGLAGKLAVSPLALDYGLLALGAHRERSFTVRNSGSTTISVLKSKPPALGAFVPKTALDEGTPLEAGATLTETISFAPTVAGTFKDGWTLTATDGLGVQTVTTTGIAIAGMCSPDGSDYRLNGTATLGTGEIVLTPANQGYAAGTAFCPNVLPSATLDVGFDFYEGDGSGADGMALVLADASKVGVQALGGNGSALGYGGIAGIAVAFDTFQSPGDPSASFVGIARGRSQDMQTLDWVSTVPVAGLRGVVHHAHVYVSDGVLVVELDGAEILRQQIPLPPIILLGFSGGSGGATDRHAVSNISAIDRALVPPPTMGEGGAGGMPSEGGAAGTPAQGGTTSSGGADHGGAGDVTGSGASAGEPSGDGGSISPAGGDGSSGEESTSGGRNNGSGGRAATGGTVGAGGSATVGGGSDDGCSCRAAGKSGNATAPLPALFALAFLARRRRQRQAQV